MPKKIHKTRWSMFFFCVMSTTFISKWTFKEGILSFLKCFNLKKTNTTTIIWNLVVFLACLYLMVNISTSPAWKSEVFHFPPNLDVISNASSVNQPVPVHKIYFHSYVLCNVTRHPLSIHKKSKLSTLQLQQLYQV